MGLGPFEPEVNAIVVERNLGMESLELLRRSPVAVHILRLTPPYLVRIDYRTAFWLSLDQKYDREGDSDDRL